MNIAAGIFMMFVSMALLGVAAFYLELFFWYYAPLLYGALWYWDRRRRA